VEFRVITNDGAVRHMLTRGRPFYDESGKPVRMSGVTMDVTLSRQTEVALQAAKEAAEAANQAKDSFLAILSHELRTPLTPVLAAVAMIEEDSNLPGHVLEDIAMIRRNVEVEARLIDDLLDVTRVARGKLELHRQVVDARPLLEHALQSASSSTASC
jgi:two-component system CheB/CheR fusion protein